jgi:hypothetical protein
LAGRIHFVELSPLVLTEIAQNAVANLGEVNQIHGGDKFFVASNGVLALPVTQLNRFVALD